MDVLYIRHILLYPVRAKEKRRKPELTFSRGAVSAAAAKGRRMPLAKKQGRDSSVSRRLAEAIKRRRRGGGIVVEDWKYIYIVCSTAKKKKWPAKTQEQTK